PPAIVRTDHARSPADGDQSPAAATTRRFFFAASASRAAGEYDGATTHSRNVSTSRRASASSISRLIATMPPNALVGSHARARAYAAARSSPAATPHGLLCLTITAAGAAISSTRPSAASRLRMLLYESCLPPRTS